MKKALVGLFAFLCLFLISVGEVDAAKEKYPKGDVVITAEQLYETEVFRAKKGTIYLQSKQITDPEYEYIDIRVELYKADGTLVQTRVGNVYNFVTEADSPFTVPKTGKYYFRFVNETPGSNWYMNYQVSDKSDFWDNE